MQFRIQLTIDQDHQQETIEITLLDKHTERIEDLGLTLAEAKEILRELQRHVVGQQAEAYAEKHRPCPACGRARRKKGFYPTVFRTLFGNVQLESPRLYHCTCEEHKQKTFSPLTEFMAEHTAPELLYLETKWASLAPYAKVADLLKDVLPVSSTTNAATIRNHLQKVAERDEQALGEERVFFAEGCPREWAELPRPDGPITVGIDGGYMRNWNKKSTHFGVIAGKSVPTDHAASPHISPKTGKGRAGLL